MRWITTTNHKDIGTLYLWFSFIMFIAGGTLALTIRSELFHPGCSSSIRSSSTRSPRCTV
jgi:cytochrome c oxidase subunit 1